MGRETVGISILTNANRRKWLERCIGSFLSSCYYRPLTIAIFNNGSTDDTIEYLSALPKVYGVNFVVASSSEDQGCAVGTNRACSLVRDFKYAIHLESDFIHMSEQESGADKMWLHRAIAHMETGDCHYLYLRRMRNHEEMMMHWWGQWMTKLEEGDSEFMSCPEFWWSNNPALRNNEMIYSTRTLPLDESVDGAKGTEDWSKPEMTTTRPPKPYLHRWGMFAHEQFIPLFHEKQYGCKKFGPFGNSTCKYGFFNNGEDDWCRACDKDKGVEDMPDHEHRFRNGVEEETKSDSIALGTVVVSEAIFNNILKPYITDDVDLIVRKAEDGVSVAAHYNKIIDSTDARFLILCHPDVEFTPDVYDRVCEQLGRDDVGVVGLTGPHISKGKILWGQKIKEPVEGASMDGCFIAIDRDKGLRFDEETFDGLHLYAEDLCYQARDRGLKVMCIPAKKFLHLSETVTKKGTVWGDYRSYRSRLRGKWKDKFEVKTT